MVNTASERSSSDSDGPHNPTTTPLTTPEDEVNPSPAPAKEDPSYIYINTATAPATPCDCYDRYHPPPKPAQSFPRSPFRRAGDPLAGIPEGYRPSVRLFIIQVQQARKRYRDRPDVSDLFSYATFDSDESMSTPKPTASTSQMRPTILHFDDTSSSSSESESSKGIYPLRPNLWNPSPGRLYATRPLNQYPLDVVESTRIPQPPSEWEGDYAPPPPRLPSEEGSDVDPKQARARRRKRLVHRPYEPTTSDRSGSGVNRLEDWDESQQCWNLGYWTKNIHSFVSALYPEMKLTWGVDRQGTSKVLFSDDHTTTFGLIVARGKLE